MGGNADVDRRVNTYSLMRLLITPLPLIVPFFSALKAVASSLKYWMIVPGSGPRKGSWPCLHRSGGDATWA
jgi:hypothetical protein